MKYAGWLLDAGTEHERAIAGAGYAPSMGGMTAEPLVLRSDALVEIERMRAVALQHISHSCEGGCPDDVDQTLRDPNCPACQVLG